jgi:hypothetical protein
MNTTTTDQLIVDLYFGERPSIEEGERLVAICGSRALCSTRDRQSGTWHMAFLVPLGTDPNVLIEAVHGARVGLAFAFATSASPFRV